MDPLFVRLPAPLVRSRTQNRHSAVRDPARAATTPGVPSGVLPETACTDPRSESILELIRACLDTGDAKAWQDFIVLTHGVVAGTVARTARRFGQASPELVADLIQEAYLRLCENRCRVLREFHSDVPEAIFGLLKTVAFSVTQDHFRAGLAAKRGSGRPDQVMDSQLERVVAGPDGLPAIERGVLLNEIDQRLRENESPLDRRIFWLYYRQGFTTRAIAALPEIGLTQKGIESAIQRLTARVRIWVLEKDPSAVGEHETPRKGKQSSGAL
jgi:RNA polymerase sigma-70 factor (ECF subfamily)